MKQLLAVLLLCLPAFGAGSVSSSVQPINQNGTAFMVTINWQGDASTGSVPTTTINGLGQVQGYTITQFQTVPGTPAPTAGYSITVKDVNGYDMAGGQATTLSATASASFATTSATPPIVGSLSFALTGNSVASAKGKVILYVFKPSVIAAANLLGRYGTGGDSDAITDLTGDVTASGPGSVAATLATVNADTGACGDATHVCQVTLNAKGLATAATAVAISAGTGDVGGPGSATDNALARFDGTTGKLIQNSAVTADDSGNVATSGTVAATGGLSAGSSPPTCSAGTAGVACLKEGTAPTGEAGVAELYSKTDHLLYANLNNGGEVQVPTASSSATLTNKTLDSASNTLKLAGVTVSGVSGSNGTVCFSDGACGGGSTSSGSCPSTAVTLTGADDVLCSVTLTGLMTAGKCLTWSAVMKHTTGASNVQVKFNAGATDLFGGTGFGATNDTTVWRFVGNTWCNNSGSTTAQVANVNPLWYSTGSFYQSGWTGGNTTSVNTGSSLTFTATATGTASDVVTLYSLVWSVQ